MTPLLAALGVAFAGLFLTGTLRFLGRTVPNWLWASLAGAVVLRVALVPFMSFAVSEATGAALIWATTLASSALLLSQRRADGSRGNRLLAATFPAPAVGGTLFAWVNITDGPLWVAVFFWLMAGIGLSGMQVIALVRRMADRAESERAVLASLIESVPVGLALFDHEGQLRAANQAFGKLTSEPGEDGAASEGDLVGALAERLEPREAEMLQNPYEGGTGAGSELRFKSGLRIVVAVHTVSGSRGELIGRLWLLRDVTEERRLQESLERARRLETLGGFAGGVAHDFNNQLTSVLGNATLARESLPEGHPAEETLADLVNSAEYCARLTRDVLDFARRGPARPVDIELARLLPEILNRSEGPRPSLSIEPDAGFVRADPTQVERVVANLVDNARHAAGPEGSVEVVVRRAAEPERVAIEVRDDGPGIEERARARIFDPFYTTKDVGEGSGLGLAIVYGIVTGQGGEVRVESEPGAGTRLVTTWPTASASE